MISTILHRCRWKCLRKIQTELLASVEGIFRPTVTLHLWHAFFYEELDFNPVMTMDSDAQKTQDAYAGNFDFVKLNVRSLF